MEVQSFWEWLSMCQVFIYFFLKTFWVHWACNLVWRRSRSGCSWKCCHFENPRAFVLCLFLSQKFVSTLSLQSAVEVQLQWPSNRPVVAGHLTATAQLESQSVSSMYKDVLFCSLRLGFMEKPIKSWLECTTTILRTAHCVQWWMGNFVNNCWSIFWPAKSSLCTWKWFWGFEVVVNSEAWNWFWAENKPHARFVVSCNCAKAMHSYIFHESQSSL